MNFKAIKHNPTYHNSFNLIQFNLFISILFVHMLLNSFCQNGSEQIEVQM